MKLHLRVYRESVRHMERNERLSKVCVLRNTAHLLSSQKWLRYLRIMVKECGLLASPCEYGVVPSGSVAAPRIKRTQQ